MLVLQTVLPALLTVDGPSTVTIEGGTHNMMAPPFDFIARSWIPVVERVGPRVLTWRDRHGFYAAGGGRVVGDVAPSSVVAGFELVDARRVQNRPVRVLRSNLSRDLAS
jgi:RNA 3'-terminal phosphate cyclase (ATP)